MISPGQANDDAGPDFRHAVIASEETGTVRGDVEVHVRASYWEAHGHHRDPHYNGVILHVVLRDDRGVATELESGAWVPVLAVGELQGHLQGDGTPLERGREPCRTALERLGRGGVQRTLEQAGEARFLEKASRFRRALGRQEADQVLYTGILEALGYSRNRAPFRKLARRLPWYRLRGVAPEEGQEERLAENLEGLLLEAAGLQPGPEQDPKGGGKPGWRAFRVRPSNYPLQRLRGAAVLLARYLPRGLTSGIGERLRTASGSGAVRSLVEGLTVEGAGPRGVALIGRDRAGVIAVNAVLPFLWAWGREVGDEAIARQAREVYRRYPKLAADRVVRQMEERLGTGERLLGITACHQQGMHHLSRHCCSPAQYDRCPLRGAAPTCPVGRPA